MARLVIFNTTDSKKLILHDAAGQMGFAYYVSQGSNLQNDWKVTAMLGLRDVLDKVCASNGLVWVSKTAIIQVTKANEPISTIAPHQFQNRD